jgi:hypothetical protein
MVARTDYSVMPPPRVIAALAVSLLGALPGPATATDTGAVANGNWSSAATWTNGIPGATDNAYIGSTYPTGAAATATVTLSQNSAAGNVYLGNGAGTLGTLDLSGFTLTANVLSLGQSSGTGSILRTGGGTVSVASMIQNSGSFSFAPNDVAAQLRTFNGSTVTTSAVGNVTNQVIVYPGNTLTLGADLILNNVNPPPGFQGLLDLQGNLNCNGHAISAQDVNLGYNGGPYTLTNRGPITASDLVVTSRSTPGQTPFNLTAADHVNTLFLFGTSTTLPAGTGVASLILSTSDGSSNGASAAATTSAAGNITTQATIRWGCTLTLGADLVMNPTSELDMGGTVNANGHAISAGAIYLGSPLGPGVFQNDGVVSTGRWAQEYGTQAQLRHPGDAIHSLFLADDSVLTVRDAAGQSTGLTIGGSSISDLSIAPGSDLALEVNGNALGWILRWADPNSTANHIADLQGLINGGEITISSLNGGSYALSADSLYTYVNVVPVPEPSVMLLSAAAAGLVAGVRRRGGKK